MNINISTTENAVVLGYTTVKGKDFALTKYSHVRGYNPPTHTSGLAYSLPKDWVIGETDTDLLYFFPKEQNEITKPVTFWQTIKKIFKK
jgi:hypothetical protein